MADPDWANTSIKPFQHTSRRKKALTLGRRKEKFRQRYWGSNPGSLALRTSALTTELSRHSHELRWTNPPYTSPMSVLHCWVTAMPQSTANTGRHHKMSCGVRTFLHPSVGAFFLRLVCWNGLIDVFAQSGSALSYVFLCKKMREQDTQDQEGAIKDGRYNIKQHAWFRLLPSKTFVYT